MVRFRRRRKSFLGTFAIQAYILIRFLRRGAAVAALVNNYCVSLSFLRAEGGQSTVRDANARLVKGEAALEIIAKDCIDRAESLMEGFLGAGRATYEFNLTSERMGPGSVQQPHDDNLPDLQLSYCFTCFNGVFAKVCFCKFTSPQKTPEVGFEVNS